MAPRKTRSAAEMEQHGNESDESQSHSSEGKGNYEAHDEGKEHARSEVGDKRKKTPVPNTSNKATKAKESDQATKSHEQKGKKGNASPEQILAFLLSDKALEVCRPEDELEDLSKRGKDTATYAQSLSPFEELLCAVILSRPISHRLGLRTIRTILNPPYEFRDADTIKAAGAEKVHRALDDARTQHKGKTTEEIELIAKAVIDNDWSNDLSKIREQTKNAVEEEREILRSSIKGLGKTGLDIFYRRIQWLWDEAFPFVDVRTQASLEKLGLPSMAEELLEFVEGNWEGVKFDDNEEADDGKKKRRAFVLLLERAVSADLEKKIDDVIVAATKM